MPDVFSAEKVTVSPAEFSLVKYDAAEIAQIVTELAEQFGIANPIHVVVDETTPLGKMSAEIETAADGSHSSDSVVTIRAESGALENTQRFTHFGPKTARLSLGRMLLRARDRLRSDFADAPGDLELTNQQNAAWDTYSAGRLERHGLEVNRQRWRYNHRNRFGFSDEIDAEFDRLWASDDLGWHDLPGV
jgi:hypothetical protein